MSSTTKSKPRFISAVPSSLGEQLMDRLIAIRPLRVEVVTTRHGEGEATIGELIEISDTGEAVEHGELPIFWQVVRSQLQAATPEFPWVAGRLVRVGKAYRLDALSPAEATAVERALDDVAPF